MRILWIFEHLWCQPSLQAVARRLAEDQDLTLEILCPWTDTPPVDHPRIKLTRLHCKHKLDFAARRIIHAKLEEGFDLAHAYSSRDLANLLAARRGLSRRPLMVGYRGTVNQLQTFDPGHWLTFWHPALDHVICVCEATRQSLLESRIPGQRLTTIWEGCDADLFDSGQPAALAEFEIPENAFVVGTVANMRPVKGADVLLEAARHLTDLDIYWLLIGDVRDPRIAPLASDPTIADRVRLPGATPRAGRYAGLMDLYVAPSRMEGLSMGIMEAMSQGVCPIVTRVGGSPELVRHTVDGLVVPPEDPTSLAAAIRRLHENASERKSLADSARRRTGEVFSLAAWTERLRDLYAKLIDSRQSKRGRAA